jgi:sigma-B regulation protein RsbU (phosphoserine phosphatase)
LYPDVEIDLTAGDMVIFLSDGIVEAHNRAGELYGFERLEALVARLPQHLGVAEIVKQILDSVLAFADGADPHDDITILVTRPAVDPAVAHAPVAMAGRAVV